MADARSDILARVRLAVGPNRPPAAVPRDYRRAQPMSEDTPDTAALLTLLTGRLVDYRANVLRCGSAEIARVLAGRLAERSVGTLVVPAGFPSDWLADVEAEQHSDPLTVDELDVLDATVSTCAVAIAETGTIVLDGGPGQGRRALSLIPDYLLVVVRAEQVVATVPAAVAGLNPVRPLTWISGPSATSDIELQRVEGVHGPRTLDVLLVELGAACSGIP